MPLPPQEIQTLLEAHFPGAEILLEDLAGDNDHFAVRVVSEAFQDKSRVMRHQMVYEALKGQVGGALHALSITALTPSET